MKLATQAEIKFSIKEKKKSLIEIVDDLNERLFGKNAENEFNFSHTFTLTHASYWSGINLNLNYEDYNVNISLWNSENDTRKFNEKTNEYEDLEKFIIQQYKNVLKDMSKITKYLIK